MSVTPFLRALKRCRLPAFAALLAALPCVPAAAQDDEGWQLDPFARVEAGLVASESSDDEDQLIVNGDGGYLRLQAGIGLEDEDTEFRFDADRIFVERFGSATGRDHYDRDRLTATFAQELNDDWEVQLRGRVYDDLVSIESADTDEAQGAVQVTYEPERAHRFRVSGTWRERHYDDGAGPDGTASHGDGPRFDAEYRHRLGRYHYVNFDLRAEEIDSDNPIRNFTRKSAGVSYTQPIVDDLRVRPAVELRKTRFDGRLTPDDEARRDTSVVPEVEVLWWLGNWRIEAEAKYIITSSNDPLREREGHRLSFSIGYAF